MSSSGIPGVWEVLRRTLEPPGSPRNYLVAWGAVALLKGKIAGSLFRYQNRRKWVTFALAKSKGGDAMLAKIGVLLAMLLGAFGIGGDDPRGRDE